ncbi:hypothetical protein LC55x_0717 [Lysobacter capsici]|nr:hypothetical protein LC55x_0717 [Lysobacter capsici]
MTLVGGTGCSQLRGHGRRSGRIHRFHDFPCAKAHPLAGGPFDDRRSPHCRPPWLFCADFCDLVITIGGVFRSPPEPGAGTSRPPGPARFGPIRVDSASGRRRPVS